MLVIIFGVAAYKKLPREQEQAVHIRRIRISIPIVGIEMLQGRAPKVKNELITRVTEAVVTTLGVDL